MKRIAIIGENSLEYIDILLSIWNADDCAVLIDWRIPLVSAIEMMTETNVELCYIDERNYNENWISAKIKFIPYKCSSKSIEILPSFFYEKFTEKYNKNEAVIVFSSGTTGKSKGIILSHYAINKNADAIIKYMNLGDKDVLYIIKSFSHSSTLTGELLVALKTNIKTVIGQTIVSPRTLFSTIDRFNISVLCLNPTLLKIYTEKMYSNNYSLKSLKKIYVSGSVLNYNLYLLAHKGFNNASIYNVYGLSEAGPRVTAQTEDITTNNSVGKPIDGVQIKIISPDGLICKKGEYGIIIVSTPSLFNGYSNGAKANLMYENWLNTGDIGYIDSEDNLHIIGRNDNVIIYQSHNIYPETIEEIINNTGLISNCIVKIDENEKLSCYYITSTHTELTKSQLRNVIAECKKKLASFELPQNFVLVKNIPYTSSGKILRNSTIMH